MLEAVKTGSGEGAVTGRSSRRRIFRLPAAWCRCGIGFTRSLLGVRSWDRCKSIQYAGNAGRSPTSHRLPGRDRPHARQWAMEAQPRGVCEGHLTMAVTITSDLVEAYSVCPRKAFLVM